MSVGNRPYPINPVIGSSDHLGAYPASDPQTPENLAATIFDALGLPSSTTWHDQQSRPYQLYSGKPMTSLMG